MKTKYLIVFILSLSVISAKSQTLANDTLYYNGSKVFEGQKLTLGYGSSSNKEFAFVFLGAGSNAGATDSKKEITIDKVYKQHGKVVARAIIDGEKNTFMKKRFIDLVGAIDNKELVLQSP